MVCFTGELRLRFPPVGCTGRNGVSKVDYRVKYISGFFFALLQRSTWIHTPRGLQEEGKRWCAILDREALLHWR